MKSPAITSLPNLLYLSDVPVESSYHGSLLLHRLLERYPRAKLLIVESAGQASADGRRLDGVEYRTFLPGKARLLRTRFHRTYAAFLVWTARYRLQRIRQVTVGFEAEAVLTVAHGFSWISAASYAKKHRMPLHLIIHDDWPNVTNLPRIVQRNFDTIFGQIYKQARSRLCVSPQMETEYKQRYGVSGTVLYPSRAFDRPVVRRAARRHQNGDSLTVGFAGTINSGGFARLLSILADELLKTNGALVIYGPYTADSLRLLKLDRPNVKCAGLIKSNELIISLCDDVDILYVPMSFERGGHEKNMKLSFPSKIADYTAASLPLLICGPEYCSAVKWAKAYSPVAEVVTSESAAALASALNRLSNPAHRSFLAERALAIGEKLFDHTSVFACFCAVLSESSR